MITDEYLIILLQIINSNGRIDSLLKKGLEYSQIARYIVYTVENKYVILDNGILRITQKGLEKLNTLNRSYNRFNQNYWISPLDEYRIEKLDKFDIYLPDKVK